MNKKVGVVLGIILVAVIVLLNKGDRSIDWSQTYMEEETKPFDTKIFHEQLDFWFKEQPNKNLYTTFYEYQTESDEETYNEKRNYVNVSNSFSIDEPSFDELLMHVAKGNEAFISSNSYPQFMLDTLGLEMDYMDATIKEQSFSIHLEHTNDSLVYTSKRTYGTGFFKDSTSIKKLGFFYDELCELKTNYVGVPYKKGVFYLHTAPEVFTNYQMLEAISTNYISTVLSYLSKETPYLYDRNYKIDPEISNSPLRFILSKPPLKWSWYLLLLTIGLFLLFNAKRRQRIIPIIEPLKNTTTEFVKSISTIHYEAKDYNGIIQKNIHYFLDTIRNKYHLPTNKLDDDFIKKLALKSGKPIDDIRQLVTLVIKMKAHTFTTEAPLKNLNKQLENFYKK